MQHIHNNKIRAIEKRILNHLKADNATDINGGWQYIDAYCQYFGCSADYLLGYIDLKNHLYTNIAAETGLSEKAVSALRTMKKYNDSLTEKSITPPATSIDGLNLILERLYGVQEQNRKNGLSSCGMAPSILSDIYFYINSDRVKSAQQDTVQLSDGITNYAITVPDIIDAHAEYNLIKQLDKLRDWYRENNS